MSHLRSQSTRPLNDVFAGTNTYLIGRGHQRILLDTGEGKPAWAANLKTVLSEENATVHQALLTHWHGDHVRGLNDLLTICPQATVYKHQPDEGQNDIQDGQVFNVEGATLRAFHTPGHTVDHMAFVLEEEDAIFTGDSELAFAHISFHAFDILIFSSATDIYDPRRPGSRNRSLRRLAGVSQ
jgi:glyoxylase-like metal-dependent hydrolase (beta-lactamase superfamily II)